MGEREGGRRGDERDCEGMMREVIGCIDRRDMKGKREKREGRGKVVRENGDGECEVKNGEGSENEERREE